MQTKLNIWSDLAKGVTTNKFASILSEYFEYSKNHKQKIILDLFPEGTNLYKNSIWHTIEQVASKHSVQVSEIYLETCDLHAEYPCKVVKKEPAWFNMILNYPNMFSTKFSNAHDKIFGHFVARPSWDRVILHDHIKSKAKSLYSFRQAKNKPISYENTLEDIKYYYPKDFKYYQDIADSLPASNIDLKNDKADFITFPNNTLPLAPFYKRIFVDIVSESIIDKKICFITEKTVRPILFKSPFIIMAGQGFLATLRKFGFKTFDTWWSEDYDNYTGVGRLEKIKELIDSISQMQNLFDIKLDMQENIEHNYSHLIKKRWKLYNDKIGIGNA